ncbi:MAG: hypothetical protein IJD97_10575 [Clostridia bacterium]|nr:hypothetical protein [Clostridia bacterium]
MRKTYLYFMALLSLSPVLSGCSKVGDKATSMSFIYIVTAVLSLLMLVGYFALIRKKELWFIVLFTSVFVVNVGYFLLSVSKTLEIALNANRIAYLGSVFLPLSMIMIIAKVSDIKFSKYTVYTLGIISALVFLIAASPGISDIYYKSVSLAEINGVSVLIKEYGPWHPVYLFYLLGCFFLMVAVCIHAISKKKLESGSHVAVLIVAVFVNISVWLLEQLVKIDFEFLSVSYIISELFLLSLYLMIQHQEILISSLQKKITAAQEKRREPDHNSPRFMEQCNYMAQQLPHLTPTEKAIYDCYISGMSTREVLAEMNIVENTLKFHNKNIYSKLGVSSRKQLIELASAIKDMTKQNKADRI